MAAVLDFLLRSTITSVPSSLRSGLFVIGIRKFPPSLILVAKHFFVMVKLGGKLEPMLTWSRSANCSDICYSPSGCDMMVQFPGLADLSGGNWDKKIGSMECEVGYHALGR
jgi:hypothetical protein